MPLREPPVHGIRLRGWVEHGQVRGGGVRGRRQQPVVGRVKGVAMSVRIDAHYSAHEAQTKGTLRSYLERREAEPKIEHPAWFEGCLDRWGIWIRPSEPDADVEVIKGVLGEQLQERYGIEWGDVYVVRHTDKDGHHHYHVVTPAWVAIDGETGEAKKVEITRADLAEIAREMVRELELERRVERVFEEPEPTSVGGAWDLPATAAQVATLRAHGVAARDMTRGEASLVIEELTNQRSWYAGRER